MASVVSKNPYDLLGNDTDQDPENPPKAPAQAVDKPLRRAGKRDGPTEAPAARADAGETGGRGGRGRGDGRGRGRGARRGDLGGNEQALQEGAEGHTRNRNNPPAPGEGARRGRGRGGRGARRPPAGDDRQSRTIHQSPDDQAKQAAHGWGEETGTGEWNDEKAGEQIASEERQQGLDEGSDAPVNADGEKPSNWENDADATAEEADDKAKTLDVYLAEQAEKKLALGNQLTVRKANEGSSSKFPEGTEFAKEEGEYFAGSGPKARRERERKEKNTLVLEHDYKPPREDDFRGGRGGRGRGGRGSRGRGEGEPRGSRGGRGRGGRGGFGARDQNGPSPNVADSSAFPSLGGN